MKGSCYETWAIEVWSSQLFQAMFLDGKEQGNAKLFYGLLIEYIKTKKYIKNSDLGYVMNPQYRTQYKSSS